MTTREAPQAYDAVEELVDLRSIWVGLRRQTGLFVGVAMTVMLGFIIFVMLAEDRYTAETSIVIEAESDQFLYGEERAVGAGARMDAARIDTEVELLRSRAMATRVLRRMAGAKQGAELDVDPDQMDFLSRRILGLLNGLVVSRDPVGDGAGVAEKLNGPVSTNADATGDLAQAAAAGGDLVGAGVIEPDASGSAEANDAEADKPMIAAALKPLEGGEADAVFAEDHTASEGSDAVKLAISASDIEKLQKNIEIERVGATMLIKVRAIHSDPEEAARIANVYAEEFILEKIEAQFASLRRANQWIDARLETLKNEVRESEREAARLRALEGVMEDGGAQTSFANQRIASLAAELREAKNEYTELRARYAAVRNLVRRGDPSEYMNSVLTSPLIDELRTRLATVTQRIAEYSARYGERHPALVSAVNEREQLQGQLQIELNRMVQSISSELSITAARVAALEADLDTAQSDVAEQAISAVRLQELDRDLQAPRAVYEALLSRKRELNERDQLLKADARIVALARTPDEASRPRRKLILAGGMLVALILAGGAAYGAEMFDGRIRNTRDVRLEFGESAPVVVLPKISTRRLMKHDDIGAVAKRYILQRPNNLYRESLRDLHLMLKTAEAETPRKPMTVAFTSIFGDEGNSTTAFCFAALLANAGHRVAFIDCSNGSSRRLARDLNTGDEPVGAFVPTSRDTAALDGPRQEEDAETAADGDATTALAAVKPAEPSRALADPAAVMAGSPIEFCGEVAKVSVARLAQQRSGGLDEIDLSALNESREALREHYDYVVLDAPSLLKKAEASLIAGAADAVAVSVGWRSTTRAAARVGVQRLIEANARILSFVIAKADERQRYYFRPEDRYFFYRNKFKEF